MAFSMSIALGQNIESEIGFIYMKAEYLLETERFDEAISEYTKVINIEPSYKDALVKRAAAKYSLFAYSGVESDVLQSISVNGIDAESVRLLGLSESNMENHQAAVGSLILANTLSPKDKEVLSALGTSALKSGDVRACSVLQRSSVNEDGKRYVSTICSNLSTDKPDKKRTNGKAKSTTTDTVPKRKGNTRVDDIVTNDPKPTKADTGTTPQGRTDDVPQAEEEPEAVVDDTVNEIVIDEDLTVIVKNGLGSRRIIDQPRILLLSEKAGQVTVDICVSKAGRVESAKLNESETTINTESLKSLAIRKAKEFWFGRGEEECGTIVLVINGG